jgi:hypothetical protein
MLQKKIQNGAQIQDGRQTRKIDKNLLFLYDFQFFWTVDHNQRCCCVCCVKEFVYDVKNKKTDPFLLCYLISILFYCWLIFRPKDFGHWQEGVNLGF